MPKERSAYFHLLTVYLVWGSTFVAMRAAVMENSGFEPFVVLTTRLAAASLILFGWALLRKKNLAVSRQDLSVLAISGFIIWVTGNGCVMWAEQFVDSGYATLIFSTLPIWTTLLGCLLDKKRPSLVLVWSLFAAFFGMYLLGERAFGSKNSLLVPTLVILCSTILWSISTHLQRRKPLSCSMLVASAYQQLFGTIGGFAMILITGEKLSHPTAQAWLAWSFLVIFGSVIAFNSYVTVVKIFPPTVSVTFAYVCPLITVFLGYWILGESITSRKIAGMLIILSSVYAIFHEQKQGRKTKSLTERKLRWKSRPIPHE